MAANRFFDSATTNSYLTSNILECLSRIVTEFYEVSTKSRPKYAEGQVSNFHISRVLREMWPVEGVYGGHINQKIPVRGALETIPEVEI